MLTLSIDSAGRVVIPKSLRDKLQLASGDMLEAETVGDCITLRPARYDVPLSKEKGVWVLRTGQPLPVAVVDQVLARGRAERDSLDFGPQA